MAFSLTGGKNFLWLAPEQITVNPNQPRKLFREEDLAALTDSIIRYGILQPLTVRREKGSYQLVAGERRLRAAGRAGLRRVPCFLVETDQQGSSLMALVETLQRRDLDPFEEAEGLLRLTKLYGMTQKQAAERVGKTQPAVANKIRLLKLAPRTVEIVRKAPLTERHARALLRLEEEEEQVAAARHIAQKNLNVEQTERYIQGILDKPAAKNRPKVSLRDLRLFYNSVNRALDTLRQAGLSATMEKQEEVEGKTRITILVG